MQIKLPRARTAARIAAAAATLATAFGTATLTTSAAHAADAGMPAAPYIYLGWGSPPDPVQLMSDTGAKDFTLAFLNSGGGCDATWDGQRPLTGGTDEDAINKIRGAGGDVIPSVGGWNGTKLGDVCGDANALAGAYGKVVDGLKLKAIDLDVENTEMDNNATQDKILGAVKILKQDHPDLQVIVTIGTTATGPSDQGKRLITQAKATGAPVDTWTIMPFDFGAAGSDMGDLSIQASDALHAFLKSTYGGSDDATYKMQGISSMNGTTDQSETVTTQDFQQMLDYANTHHIGRFTFWAANRDRPCPGGGAQSACSGIDQQNWDFTKIVAKYQG
ncbi:MAG TPA: chitinase [Streptosporangiaceae bacterium]